MNTLVRYSQLTSKYLYLYNLSDLWALIRQLTILNDVVRSLQISYAISLRLVVYVALFSQKNSGTETGSMCVSEIERESESDNEIDSYKVL